jgi:hypothetical protein
MVIEFADPAFAGRPQAMHMITIEHMYAQIIGIARATLWQIIWLLIAYSFLYEPASLVL